MKETRLTSPEPLYEVCSAGNVDAAREILNHDPKPDVDDLDVSATSQSDLQAPITDIKRSVRTLN
jgi:hypothetical protein